MTVKPPSTNRLDKQAIGIIVSDVTNSRLLVSASTHLGLRAEATTLEKLSNELLFSFELLIADEAAARKVVDRLNEDAREDDPYRPTVIAITTASFNINDGQILQNYDGVLPMPQLPDVLAAQLSVALYSHRAFARRYESQIDELQRNRQIFGSVTSGMTVCSTAEPDLPLQYVNPAFEAMTGYTLEESRGKNCRFLQRGEQDQPGLTLVREAIRDGKNTVAILRNYRKDGSVFWNELSLSPIRSADGHVTHFIGIQANVTERVEFEQALRESEKLAVTGRLAAAIAHEINNPLESITNLAYLAQGSQDVAEIHGYLETLDAELRRVKLITSQALRFSRQSSRPEAIDAKDLLDSILDIQHARIQATGVRVERRDRFGQLFVALESEIRQVLNNLISNATDAMRRKPGVLYVRSMHATNWKTGVRGVVFTVADAGEGMSPETRSSLYKAFYSTKGTQGTGLGLWVSAEIVQRHHGNLRFRSTEGKGKTGTIFRLFLPYQSVALAPTEPAPAS